VAFVTNSILASSKHHLHRIDKVLEEQQLNIRAKDNVKEDMVSDPVKLSISNHRMLEQLMEWPIEAIELTRALSANSRMSTLLLRSSAMTQTMVLNLIKMFKRTSLTMRVEVRDKTSESTKTT
jgi:hypothetical protein